MNLCLYYQIILAPGPVNKLWAENSRASKKLQERRGGGAPPQGKLGSRGTPVPASILAFNNLIFLHLFIVQIFGKCG